MFDHFLRVRVKGHTLKSSRFKGMRNKTAFFKMFLTFTVTELFFHVSLSKKFAFFRIEIFQSSDTSKLNIFFHGFWCWCLVAFIL